MSIGRAVTSTDKTQMGSVRGVYVQRQIPSQFMIKDPGRKNRWDLGSSGGVIGRASVMVNEVTQHRRRPSIVNKSTIELAF